MLIFYLVLLFLVPVETSLSQEIQTDKLTDASSASGKFWFYSHDQEDLIYGPFKYKNEFFYEISFWFDLYATYQSSTIIIHDSEDLRIIYDVFSADALYKNDLNRFTKDALSKDLLNMRLQQMRDEFSALSIGKHDGPVAHKILKTLKAHRIKIPSNRTKARKFFTSLGENLRYQIGQRDSVITAISKLGPYLSTIDFLLTIFKLPLDLRTISILESSFYSDAISRVGAAGVWQIIDSVGEKFLVVNKYEDQRRNPIISALAAFRILSENFRITKSWDFTLLAYNSGISHILNFKKSSPLDIKKYLTTYTHDSFGFASRNYLFEFYSLNYALAYKKYLFPEVMALSGAIDGNFSIYVSLCPFDLVKDKPFSFLAAYNTQFFGSTIQRGSSVISKSPLPASRFYKLNETDLLTNYPNKFINLIQGQSCSTR
ncbi:MAG: transglycosylase SLT domain-containing protein [Bdellovibrio sp.]|nr:transglycosylase SLT domain-containing protein [Bdellovibrio sp.]